MHHSASRRTMNTVSKREPTMSGRVGHRKRLICVNAANLRANYLYLTGHDDFFPADCYGAREIESTSRAGAAVWIAA